MGRHALAQGAKVCNVLRSALRRRNLVSCAKTGAFYRLSRFKVIVLSPQEDESHTVGSEGMEEFAWRQ